MKFFEQVICEGFDRFQKLSTEDKHRYAILYGHYNFSHWIGGILGYNEITLNVIVFLAVFIGIVNMFAILFMDRAISMPLFYISLPIEIGLILWEKSIIEKFKMEKEELKEWSEKAQNKIQNILFSDFRVFSIWKRIYVRIIDKKFYKHLLNEECRGKCYECTFKLAFLLKDSKIKIIWMAATDVGEPQKYGHAVIEKNGIILDTNTRRSYKKEKYLIAQKAEIFKEYSLDEYRKVISPWELDWEQFGKWCEERKVSRCK